MTERSQPAILTYASTVAATDGWSVKAVFLTVLLAGLGLALPCIVTGLLAVMGSFLAGTGLFACIFGFAAAAGFSRRLRHQRVLMVLGYLDQAVRLNLPLPAILQAAANSESGRLARRLRDIHSGLLAGYPLGESLLSAMPEMPERVARQLASAERTGRLAPVLARVLEEERQRHLPRVDTAVMGRFYPMVIGVLLVFLITGVMIFVVPKYREIFLDFKTDLPASTQWLITAAAQWSWLFFILALLAVVCVLSSLANNMIAMWIVPPPVRWLRRLTQRLVWLVPLARGLARDRGLADICAVLADTLGAGYPAPSALREARTLEVNVVLAEKIAAWGQRVEAGAPFAQAAADARLPGLLVGLLTAARDSAATAATLNFLARYYRGRFSRTATTLQAAWLPLMVLLMGSLVGFVMYALISPLRLLIDAAVQQTGIL